jgi:hypothetical protein
MSSDVAADSADCVHIPLWEGILGELIFSLVLTFLFRFIVIFFAQETECEVLFVQALSGIGESIQNRANILGNTALNAALNTQFLFQIGIFTAVPMILGCILEQGFLAVIPSTYY